MKVKKLDKTQICLCRIITYNNRTASFSCCNYKGNFLCSANRYGDLFNWVFPAWIPKELSKEELKQKYEPCRYINR